MARRLYIRQYTNDAVISMYKLRQNRHDPKRSRQATPRGYYILTVTMCRPIRRSAASVICFLFVCMYSCICLQHGLLGYKVALFSPRFLLLIIIFDSVYFRLPHFYFRPRFCLLSSSLFPRFSLHSFHSPSYRIPSRLLEVNFSIYDTHPEKTLFHPRHPTTFSPSISDRSHS